MAKKEVVSICLNPIFVVGCPRSGTSVLSWSLAQHSKTWLSAESDFFIKIIEMAGQAYKFGTKRGQKHWLSKQNVILDELFKHIGYGLNSLYTDRSKGKRWIEQTPLYTFYIDKISKLFPYAKFVHIVRDGRDVVNSMINSGFDSKWATDFSYGCETYKLYLTSMNEFQTKNPSKVIRVHLEEVIENPEKEFKRVCKFLGLKFQKTISNHFKKGRMNSSYQSDKERQKKSWKNTWTKQQKTLFDNECGDVMKIYGYY